MSQPWPTGLPDSLWSYRLLASEDRPYLPMMGVDFTSGFLYAFAFGAAFLMVSAWVRFSRMPSEAGSGYALLTKLDAGDLGGRSAMIRAYLIYAFALLSVFVAMTFFGKLIIQAANAIPLAGISVDAATLKFDSPEWPLMLAFGFAGLAPLLPPLEVAEQWLRNRTFRAVGIPIRIEQTTRSIVSCLEKAARPQINAKGPDLLAERLAAFRVELDLAIDRSWAQDILGRRSARRANLLGIFAQLELLVEWARTSRGVWPGPEVSQKLRDVEASSVERANEALTTLLALLAEAAPTQAAQVKERDAELARIERDFGLVRDDLAVLLAIYMERDPDDPGRATRRHDKALSELLRRSATLDEAGVGPEAGVLVTLVLVFFTYLIASWKGYHTLLSAIAPTTDLKTVLMTAIFETLRVAAIVWLPLLIAFSLRQYLSDNRDWMRRFSQNPSRYISQRIAALFLAAGVSVVGLCGVAMLAAFGVAETADRFRELLFGGRSSFILYYPSQFVLSVFIVGFSLHAADARARGRRAIGQGLLSALVVFCLIVAHYRFWGPPDPACSQNGTYPFDVFRSTPGVNCVRLYNAIDLLVLPLLALLAATVFGVQAGDRRQRTGRGKRTGGGKGWLPRRARATAAASVVILLLSTVAALSESVVVGFRADAEPFSYRKSGAVDGDPLLFDGFLAELCYDIFADGLFAIEAQEVTADDRFARLRQEGDTRPEAVDMLCDPVTMRFSDSRRREVGVFSPIVFASGVSYFQRISRSRGDLFIGYVAGSTAADVARRACAVDLFRVIGVDQRDGLLQRCEVAAQLANARAEALSLKRDIDNGSGSLPQDFGDQLEKIRAPLDEAKTLINQTRPPHAANVPPPPPYLAFDREFWGRQHIVTLRAQSLIEAAEAEDSPAHVAADRIDELYDALDDCGDPPAYFSTNRRQIVHFCVMPTHNDLIEWFCGPGSQGRKLVYMGDRELVRGKLDTWQASRDSCDVETPQGAETLTYEPYALLVTKAKPKLIQFVQRRVYEIFSRRMAANSLFAEHFPGRVMSPPLAYLFLLNAVEDEKDLGPRPPPRTAAGP